MIFKEKYNDTRIPNQELGPKVDPFKTLPDELLLKIFSLISIDDIRTLPLVSTDSRNILNDKTFYQIVTKDLGIPYDENREVDWRKYVKEQIPIQREKRMQKALDELYAAQEKEQSELHAAQLKANIERFQLEAMSNILSSIFRK